MLNQVTLQGRLTKDPELRYTPSGTAVTSFTVACDRDYTGKDGGDKQVDFIPCVAWRATAEHVSKWFHKGSPIVVTGRLQVRDYKDQDGATRRITEIIVSSTYFAGGKNDGTDRRAEPQYDTESKQEFEELADDDGDLPF